MARKSTWLCCHPQSTTHPNQSISLPIEKKSAAGELCTLEIVAELLEQLQEADNAQALRHFLQQFMTVFQADKSGHIFQHP
ncbi:hypothetical protein P4S72_09775 [Vibrio sp. PP-XX7]